jgi:hypothetical protein
MEDTREQFRVSLIVGESAGRLLFLVGLQFSEGLGSPDEYVHS